jgi:hypothetical protein
VGFRSAQNRANFQAHVNRLRSEGKCQCFECLRGEGFTPPLSERRSHPGISPHRIFGKDECGEPVLTEGKGSKQNGTDAENEAGSTLEEKTHLKEAVANRDVI